MHGKTANAGLAAPRCAPANLRHPMNDDEPKSAAELKEIRINRKLAQDAEGIKAMADIAAADIAIRKRTANLRAIRLAKEAADRDKPRGTQGQVQEKEIGLNDTGRSQPRRCALQQGRTRGQRCQNRQDRARRRAESRDRQHGEAEGVAPCPRGRRSLRPAATVKKARAKSKTPGEKSPALADWLAGQQSGGRRT